jgi:hypothetical protein
VHRDRHPHFHYCAINNLNLPNLVGTSIKAAEKERTVTTRELSKTDEAVAWLQAKAIVERHIGMAKQAKA